MWSNITILGIVDHHEDHHLAPNATPRIVAESASCSSLVTEAILDSVGHLPYGPSEFDSPRASTIHGPIPEELIELLLRTIALDSGGLKKSSSFPVDYMSAQRLLEISSWRGRDLKEVMKTLKKDMKAAVRFSSTHPLEFLTHRCPIRFRKTPSATLACVISYGETGRAMRESCRGSHFPTSPSHDSTPSSVPTKSVKYPTLSLGFASMSVSLNDQILRLPEQTTPEWFAVERG